MLGEFEMIEREQDELAAELAALEAARDLLELSDDFCYTNGKMQQLDQEIQRVTNKVTNLGTT